MGSVNFYTNGWAFVLSCGNIKFARFGMIFSGMLPDSSNACGIQGCVDRAGKTRIPVAWSWHVFLMTFVSRLNGGNIYMKGWLQYIEKASTAKAFGSGFQETYFSILIQLANKSISGVPKVSHTALYILGYSYHSIAFRNFLEFLSASKLSLLEMSAAIMCKSLLVHKIQIFFSILLHSWDFRPPFLFIYMAVVLSDIILICLKFLSLQ